MASNGGNCGHGLIRERMHPYSSEELTHGAREAGRGSLLCLAELARGRRRSRERDFFTRSINVQGV
jgi:hypothetical protein